MQAWGPIKDDNDDIDTTPQELIKFNPVLQPAFEHGVFEYHEPSEK